MTSQQALQQAADEEQSFFRCIELCQLAQRSPLFTKTDIQDLMYHLRVTDYFKEPK